MARPILRILGRIPGRRSARALPALATCAILLAGCGASLQDELASGLGQQPGEAAVAETATTAEERRIVTTASTAAGSEDEAAADSRTRGGEAKSASARAGATPGAAGASPVTNAALVAPDAAASSARPEPAAVRLPAAAEGFTSMAEPGHVAYRIGPLDVITISVFRVPELSTTVQVADTGTINLPLIGEVPASGRTAQEVEQDVTARLGEKYLQNPQVTVFIKEYNARRVTVDGSVKKPGVYPLRGRTSLLQAITMAEGLDNNRASGEVIVFRQIDGTRSAARFDLDEIRDGTAKDPIIEPGDVVIVDDSSAKIVLHNVLRVLPITNVFRGFVF